MTDYDNTNSGTLFKNDMEGKSEKFPPYGGSINVEGVEYWISAWVKEGKSGKFFSGKMSEPYESSASRPELDDFSGTGLPF